MPVIPYASANFSKLQDDLREKAEQLGANMLEKEWVKRHGPYAITVDASGDPDNARAIISASGTNSGST